MTLPHLLLLSLFPALVIAAALTDAASFTIPNRLTLLIAAAYGPIALMLGCPLPQIGLCMLIGLVALVVAVIMFAAGWIGGGDAKLFAGAALWLGWPATGIFLMVTALAGGALAVALLNLRADWVKPYLAGAPPWFARLATSGAAVPYGVAIAIGALAAFPHATLVQVAHGTF